MKWKLVVPIMALTAAACGTDVPGGGVAPPPSDMAPAPVDYCETPAISLRDTTLLNEKPGRYAEVFLSLVPLKLGDASPACKLAQVTVKAMGNAQALELVGLATKQEGYVSGFVSRFVEGNNDFEVSPPRLITDETYLIGNIRLVTPLGDVKLTITKLVWVSPTGREIPTSPNLSRTISVR